MSDVPPIAVADPPRRIPPRLRFVLTWGNPGVALGSLFFGIGLVVLTLVTVSTHRAVHWATTLDAWTDARSATGRVVAERQRGREGRLSVRQVEYTYVTPDGQTRRGTFEERLNNADDEEDEGVGSPVEIEYLPQRPEVSRVVGTSEEATPPRVPPIAPLFAFGFIAAGGSVVSLVLALGRRPTRLVSYGLTAWGVLRSVEIRWTSGTAGHGASRWYDHTFAYEDESGATCVAIYTSQRRMSVALNATTLLFYDPERPSQILPRAALPVSVDFDNEGELTTNASALWYLWLLPPILAILAPCGYGLVRALA